MYYIIFSRARDGGSQSPVMPIAATYVESGAYSMRHVDAFSFSANEASLAEIEKGMAGLYSERRFMLSDLTYCFASVALPTHSGNFGGQAVYFGSADYSQSRLGLAYARKLGGQADVGVQFNYDAIRVAGYGASSTISFEAGIILHISEKLHTGFHIVNPEGGRFGHGDKLPSVYTLGFGYDASQQFFFSAEIIKEENRAINITTGFQYHIVPRVLVRGGISSATTSVYFGSGVYFSFFRLDVITHYHPQLGFSPGLMLLLNLKKKES
jgi:hypothetical protein